MTPHLLKQITSVEFENAYMLLKEITQVQHDNAYHYENMPIEKYWKSYHRKTKIFFKKSDIFHFNYYILSPKNDFFFFFFLNLIFFIILLRT